MSVKIISEEYFKSFFDAMEDRMYSCISKFQYQLKEFKSIRCEFIMQVKENAYAIYKLGKQIPRPKTLKASTHTPYWSFQWRSYSQYNLDLKFPDPDTKVLNIPMKPNKRDNQPPVEIINHSCRMDRPDTSICSKSLKKFVLIGPPPPQVPVEDIKTRPTEAGFQPAEKIQEGTQASLLL